MDDQGSSKKGLWDYPEAKEREKTLATHLLKPKQFWGALAFIVGFLLVGYFVVPLVLFNGKFDLLVLVVICAFIYFASMFVAKKLGLLDEKGGGE